MLCYNCTSNENIMKLYGNFRKLFCLKKKEEQRRIRLRVHEVELGCRVLDVEYWSFFPLCKREGEFSSEIQMHKR